MAEEEEEGSQNLEAAENDMQNQEDADNDMQQHNDGFQVSLSKHQKKAQRKKIQSSKESYATRSRVNSKPFK
jgi:hypothetical protein